MYPVLFAAGGVFLEDLTRRRRWIATSFAVVLLLTGAAIAPMALPVLPVETYVAYSRALGQTPSSDEKKEMGRLPQFYADMFGWPEMTSAVRRVVETLPPEERAHTVLRANDYGQAGALQFFGPDLPPVACGHNNFWLWGPGEPDPEVEVRLGRPEDAEFWRTEVYEDCDEAGTFEHPWVMPYENDLGIYVCRHPHVPLGERWIRSKHFE